MAYSIGSISSWVHNNRLTSGTLPTWLSGNNLHSLASGACIDLKNMVGEGIGAPTSINEKYFNILVNLTALYAQGAIEGVNTSWSAAGLSVSKGASPFMSFLVDQVNRSIQGIGRKINYYKVQR